MTPPLPPLTAAMLAAANKRRSASAATATVARVREALNVLGDQVLPTQAEIGRLRITHPDVSIAELGAFAGLSKDIAAGRLRRLLLAAAKIKEERLCKPSGRLSPVTPPGYCGRSVRCSRTSRSRHVSASWKPAGGR